MPTPLSATPNGEPLVPLPAKSRRESRIQPLLAAVVVGTSPGFKPPASSLSSRYGTSTQRLYSYANVAALSQVSPDRKPVAADSRRTGLYRD